MMRRNIPNRDPNAKTVIEFNYPSQEEIHAMVREAQLMRAQAMRETFRWIWAALTRRRPAAPAAGSAILKA